MLENTPTVSRGVVEAAIEGAYSWNVHVIDGCPTRFDPIPFSASEMQDPWRIAVPHRGFTTEELALVDSRLADVMQHAYDVYQDNLCKGYSKLPYFLLGSNIRYTLQSWSNAMMTLPGEAFLGRQRQYWGFYVGLEDLVIDEEKTPEGRVDIVMHFAACNYDCTPGGIEYVDYHNFTKASLDPRWLTQHHPAWRQGLAVATSMDLSGPELVAQVLAGPLQYITGQPNTLPAGPYV